MPPQGPSGGQGGADNSLAALWITLGLFILAGMIWYFFRDEISEFIVIIRSYEADFIAYFVPQAWSGKLQAVQSFAASLKGTDYRGVTLDDLVRVSNYVGDYLRYPIMLLLILGAARIYFGNPLSRFKKTYSMERMRLDERETWPKITPVTNIDLIKTDLDEGPWRMAEPPMDFAKKNNLLIVEKTLPKDTLLASKAILTATIHRDEARKCFAFQIGGLWRGVDRLPIHLRALYAIFAARIVGDREGPAKLIDQMALSTAKGRIDFTGADELLKKHRDNKLVKKVEAHHAYITTVMAGMLEVARTDGVVATADFLWLKPVDRRMWLMLNCVGRQTPYAEVSGPFAHWLAEKELGRKLNVPMVEEAVNGLAAVIAEYIYKPSEDENFD